MQSLLDWLINELQDPAKAAGGMLGSTVAFLVLLVMRVVREDRKRSAAEEKKVDPIVCAVPEPKPPSDVPLEVRLHVWQLQDTVTELRGRLATCDGQLKESKAEESRIKVALSESRDREQALALELADLRRTIDSGFTRVRLPESRVHLRPVNVTEISDEKTPQQGKGRR